MARSCGSDRHALVRGRPYHGLVLAAMALTGADENMRRDCYECGVEFDDEDDDAVWATYCSVSCQESAESTPIQFPAERAYFGPDLTRVNDLIRQHCGPYEAREEFADMCEECGGYRENAVCHHVGRFAACHNRDPLFAGGQCTLPVGHQGKHRNNTGLFWK